MEAGNTKLVLKPWGCEIHTRKEGLDAKGLTFPYSQTGAAVESGGPPSAPGLLALEHTIGRKVTIGERSTLRAKGFLEV